MQIHHYAVESLLTTEIQQLKALSYPGEEIETDLISKFPKICKNCQTCYETPEDFNQNTKPIKGQNITYVEEINKVSEFRNCTCGSTLALIFKNRRREDAFSNERRKIFLSCKTKIMDEFSYSESIAIELVRRLFQDFGAIRTKIAS